MNTDDDSLMKLGGFAATLKLVITMTQWRLTQREHGADARTMSRAAAIVMMLGVAVVCAVGPIKAEAHPLRVHSADAVQQTHTGEQARAKSRSSVYKSTANRTPNSTANANAVAAHRHAALANQSAQGAHPKAVQHSGTKHKQRRVKRSPKQTSDAGTTGDASTAAIKPLTVDDFLHAATTAPPMAKLEAAPANIAPEISHAAPSDLVGAPFVPNRTAPERGRRTQHMRIESAAEVLPAPTRQEITEEVEQPIVLPGLYRNGRLIVPRPLKGSREVLVHQNMVADDEGLNRIQDNDDLQRMRGARLLVDFPETSGLHLNPELSEDRRCARPWTVRFASDISRSFYARFHQPLQVNSAARTVAYQMRLRRVNGNAAGIDGEVASPHLTGQALDFGKRGMSTAQIAWMRMYLLPLMQTGEVDVEEEFQQSCFHISVYRTYEASQGAHRRSLGRNEVAQLHYEPRVLKTSGRADLDR